MFGMRSGGRGEMRFRAPFFFALCGRVDLELEWWVGGMATRKKEFHGHYIRVNYTLTNFIKLPKAPTTLLLPIQFYQYTHKTKISTRSRVKFKSRTVQNAMNNPQSEDK